MRLAQKSTVVFSSMLVLLLSSGCCGMASRETGYYSGDQTLFQPEPDLDATIVGCTTHFGIDGETTTVYVKVANYGDGAANNVAIKFEANDGDYNVPPTADIGRVPASRQITISRSIDTRFGTQTDVAVTVTAEDTSPIIRQSADCRQLDSATIQNLETLVQYGLIPV